MTNISYRPTNVKNTKRERKLGGGKQGKNHYFVCIKLIQEGSCYVTVPSCYFHMHVGHKKCITMGSGQRVLPACCPLSMAKREFYVHSSSRLTSRLSDLHVNGATS